MGAGRIVSPAGRSPTVDGTAPLYGFQRKPTLVDYPGHVAAVFFAAGCNFRCRYCHNPELIASTPHRLSWARLERACTAWAADWVDAAVVTGGEPTLHEDLPECLARLRRRGWRVKLDTNGSRPDRIEACLPYVDYVAMDIKAGRSAYAELTGFDDMADIERSIELIQTRAPDSCFRTTVLDPFHTDEQMREIGEMVRGARRYILQPFVPRETVADAAWVPASRTSPQRLNALRHMLRDCAREVVVAGAIPSSGL